MNHALGHPDIAPPSASADPNPCHIGWAPCPSVATGGHVCDRGGGHTGRCRCAMCGARRQERAGIDAADALMSIFGLTRVDK